MSPIGDSHRARWCQACEDWHFTHETCAAWQGGGHIDPMPDPYRAPEPRSDPGATGATTEPSQAAGEAYSGAEVPDGMFDGIIPRRSVAGSPDDRCPRCGQAFRDGERGYSLTASGGSVTFAHETCPVPATDDDELREALAGRLELVHWDGTGCGTNGPAGCLHCYGPSPMGAHEVADAVLAVLREKGALR